MSEFKGTLLDFQREAVLKLAPQPNVLIADEQGLGKTYTAIALDCLRREKLSHKTLVIAPKGLHFVWLEHFTELTDLSVVVTNNATKAQRQKRWNYFVDSDADVFIINYESVKLLPELIKQKWRHIICDEVHRIGNRNSASARAVKKLKKVDYRTGLSGTPGEKDHMWSILNWLWRARFSNYWDWNETYIKSFTPKVRDSDGDLVDAPYAIIQGWRTENLPVLHNKIEPFYVRRLKKDVLKELPDKYYTEIKVDMAPKQAREYHSMRRIMLAWVGEQEGDTLAAPLMVSKLTRLQQMSDACLFLDHVDDDGKEHWDFMDPSPKVDGLLELLSDSGDKPFVVFSQFAKLINFIERKLIAEKIPCGKVIGAVPMDQRRKVVSDFQSGASRVFLGTIAAAGEGITLHRASTEVFMDRTWAPRFNGQAEDRCHRIGQKNAVQVIDFMSNNTVDMGRKAKLETKKEWARQILGDRG